MLTESFPCMILHRRNIACIGCGCPRSTAGNAQAPAQRSSHSPTSRGLPSPRFNPMTNIYYSSGPPGNQPHNQQQQQQQPSHKQLPLPPTPHSAGRSVPLPPPSPFGSPSPVPHVATPPKATHPLLTPSGRAFAVGGKVQNVSSDPLSPCIMYWPDNEPFPEQGQIRPSGLVGVAVRFEAANTQHFIDDHGSSSLPSLTRVIEGLFLMYVKVML